MLGSLQPAFDAWAQANRRMALQLGVPEADADALVPAPEMRDAMLGCFVEVADALGWLNGKTGPVLAGVQGGTMMLGLYAVPTITIVRAAKRDKAQRAATRAANSAGPSPDDPRVS